MMKKGRKTGRLLAMMLAAVLLSGCAAVGDENGPATMPPMEKAEDEKKLPMLPEKLSLNSEGIPVLSVYQVDEEETKEMDLETYLQGVLAGEMKNDWPMEALKAQAILARTFVLKFCTEKESKYEGADISTDIEEAQAYDATGVNERIEQAVAETRGQVLSFQGELPYAWFHAHSGGMTAKAAEGLAYDKPEPGYTKIVQGGESDAAPEETRHWRAAFSMEEIRQAAEKAGLPNLEMPASIAIRTRGDSGRAVALEINGRPVSAPELRLALGSSRMRSTLLTGLRIENGQVIMEGKGYGHGVGMPQWGAYAMAEEGKKAEEIVTHYFQGVTVEKLW